MTYFEWSDEMSVGIQRIDLQHKKIVALSNALFDAMSAGKGRDVLGNVLKDLVTYTRTHLKDEERILSENGYPEFEAHKAKHDKMTGRVLALYADYQEGKEASPIVIANFVKDWLKKHIMGTDKQYASFLISKGL
jgi:hemerythrin